MRKDKITAAVKIVEKGWQQYKSACDDASLLIRDKVEFDFSIAFQPSDGPVVEYKEHNAPLDTCIEFINTHGKLDIEGYLSMTI